MKRTVRTLLDRSVPLEVARMRHWLLARLEHPPVLVYTMGKVGSSTVFESLKQARISPLSYHVHFLTPANLERIQKKYESSGNSMATGVKLRSLLSGNLNHLSSSKILSSLHLGKSSYIVTLVRDPIDTFLSHVLQNPKTHRPFLLNNDGKLSESAVKRYVRESLSSFSDEGDYISNWFDDEFSVYCGIDVYAHPFDRPSGFSIIREKPWNVAIVALEKLSASLPMAINELFGKPYNIQIINRNIRTNTRDRDAYLKVKEELSVPAECLQRIYATRYARHFFSSEHIQSAIEKWSE